MLFQKENFNYFKTNSTINANSTFRCFHHQLLLQKLGNVFCHNNNQCFVLLNFVDVAKVESSKKQKKKNSKFGYTIMEGQIVFFLVMNFCTAILTHEKKYFISNAWIYYQRVVSKKIEGNFGFGRNVVSFWLPS